MDLGAAFLEGVAQFAGSFTNPVAALAVVAAAWLVRSRRNYRLCGATLGMGLALPEVWTAGLSPAAAMGLLGGGAGVLLQVELMLGVVLPVLAFLRRLRDLVLSLFRTPPVPPSP